jgi:hypothetical protein
MKSMTLKLALLAGLGLASAAATYAPPAMAAGQVAVRVGVGIGVAPPPPRFERLPPPRRGYVWAPGYWRWEQRAHRHVWVGGHWLRARHGYYYHRARWVHQGRHWRFRDGYWSR